MQKAKQRAEREIEKARQELSVLFHAQERKPTQLPKNLKRREKPRI